MMRPTHVFMDKDQNVYVSELGLRVSIFTIDGRLITRWGSFGQSKETDVFVVLHALAVDSRGDICVGEVATTFAKYDRGVRDVSNSSRRSRGRGQENPDSEKKDIGVNWRPPLACVGRDVIQ